jgi:hypothetical protein
VDNSTTQAPITQPGPEVPSQAAIEAAAQDPRRYPGPNDVTADLLGQIAGCWRRARLSKIYPRAHADGTKVGTVVHKVLETAGTMRLRGLLPKTTKAKLGELRRILDELLAQGDCPQDSYEGSLEVLRAGAPIDFSELAAVEEVFQVILEKQTEAAGIFDRVDERIDQHGELRKVIIQDYKSGRTKTQEELHRDPQTVLYLIAARELYPELSVRIEVRYHYVRWNKLVTVDWDAQLDSWGRTWIVRVVDLWLAGKDTPNPGAQCGRCEFSPHCEEGTKWLKKQLRRTEKTMADDLVGVAQELDEVKQALKGLRSYSARLGREAQRLLLGQRKREEGGWWIRRGSRQKSYYHPGALSHVHQALARAAIEAGTRVLGLDEVVRRVCKLSGPKLKELVGDNTEALRIMEDHRSLDMSEWVEVGRSKPFEEECP